MKGNLTLERLREVLWYDTDTGVFVWLKSLSNKAPVGCMAGTFDAYGYLLIGIDRVSYHAHRLAWMYVYGTFPSDCIDHRNGVRNDNRMCNLRECSRAENQQNKALKKGKKYPLGVTFIKGRYRAEIRFEKKSRHLGYFATPEAAHEAYLAAKASLHIFNPIPRP